MKFETLHIEDVSYLKGGHGNNRTPIVMVHGAYNDARVWTHTFMPFFERQGYPVYAINLKQQENVHKIQTLFSYTLQDYVNRLHKLISTLDKPPVLIGHSMGGLIVQLYLSQYPEAASGVCLLASLAPFGMKNTVWGMIKDPQLLLIYTALTLSPSIARKRRPPQGLLSKEVSDEMASKFQKLILRESAHALWGCLNPSVNKAFAESTPLLILGAEYDHLALPKDVRKTGEFYQKDAHIYPGKGHFLIMEHEWEKIADNIGNQLFE